MVWLVIVGLPIFWGVLRLPKWWQQPRPVRGRPRKVRSWLVKVAFLASLELFGIVQLISDNGKRFHLLETAGGYGLAGLAALSACLILPVNHLSLLDFLVAPALRDQDGGSITRLPERRVRKVEKTTSHENSDPGIRRLAGDAFIRVRRANAGWQDRFRAYSVEIDGRPVGRLRRGEEIRTGVLAGRHTVRAVISRTGSLPMQVRVDAGTTVTLRVEPGMNSLIDGVRPDGYLRLSEERPVWPH